MIAQVSCLLTTPPSHRRGFIVTANFVALTSLMLLAFHAFALFDLVIGHPEYTVSLLLQSLAVRLVWQDSRSFSRRPSATNCALAVACVVLSVGTNPATVFTMGLYLVIMLLWRRQISVSSWILGSSTAIAFVFWYVVARMHGGGDYYALRPSQIVSGLRASLMNLDDALQAPWIGIMLLSWLALTLILSVVPWRLRSTQPFAPLSQARSDAPRQNLIIFILLAFAVVWTLFFSAHSWVERNAYHWRYFSFAIFAITTVIAIQMSSLVARAGVTITMVCAIALGVCAFVKLHTPAVPFEHYDIYRKVEHVAPQSQVFYSGDYWLVWPVVHRDLMRGLDAFGLTYRGIGNARNAHAFIQSHVDKDTPLTVQCIAASNAECTAEIQKIIEPSQRTCVQQINRSDCPRTVQAQPH